MLGRPPSERRSGCLWTTLMGIAMVGADHALKDGVQNNVRSAELTV